MQTEIIVRTERTPTLNMILMIIRSGIFWVQDTFRWTLTLLKYTVLRGAVFLFAVISLLWLSIFLYASFYYMYMPAESHVKPVHFTFRVCESGAGLCSFPSANISLLKDNKDEILARGQLYRIMLELDLPESPTNQYLGMFMVSFKMYDKNKDVVQTSKRSAMLRYRSSLLQILETFVFSPMFLAGIHEQRQVLPVELFSSYVDNPYKPTVGALIEIENQKIEFYSASLRIYANFSGLRYLMFNWPTVCAVFGIGTNMFFLSAIAILSWYQFYCSDTPALQFGDNLEFRENMSLEERRKKIRAVLEQEKQNQERLPIPTKSRKKPSNIDKGVKYRTSSAANPTTETLGAGSSTHHDDDLSSKESSPDTKENMAEEETLLLSIQASDIQTEDGHEGELRHRHPKH